MDLDQRRGLSRVPLAGRYAAFSVSQSKVAAVKAYIAKQKERHRKRSLQEELIEISAEAWG